MMGTGVSTKQSDDSNVDIILIEENNSFFSVFNIPVTVISSVILLMVLILIACMIYLVIKLRLCSGICHEACRCCAQCLERSEAISLNMAHLPVLGPADSTNTRLQWLEGESADKALSVPPNSRSQSNSQRNLEELAASPQYFRPQFRKK